MENQEDDRTKEFLKGVSPKFAGLSMYRESDCFVSTFRKSKTAYTAIVKYDNGKKYRVQERLTPIFVVRTYSDAYLLSTSPTIWGWELDISLLLAGYYSKADVQHKFSINNGFVFCFPVVHRISEEHYKALKALRPSAIIDPSGKYHTYKDPLKGSSATSDGTTAFLPAARLRRIGSWPEPADLALGNVDVSQQQAKPERTRENRGQPGDIYLTTTRYIKPSGHGKRVRVDEMPGRDMGNTNVRKDPGNHNLVKDHKERKPSRMWRTIKFFVAVGSFLSFCATVYSLVG